jgi:hypothetical protein
MPKGSYGINLALCEIMLKFTKLNDLIKMATAIFIPILLGVLWGLFSVEGGSGKAEGFGAWGETSHSYFCIMQK